MTARGRKSPPRAAGSESTVYSGRELAGTILAAGRGQVTALDANGRRIGVFETEKLAMAAILTAAREAR
jgi:hypothetical protein